MSSFGYCGSVRMNPAVEDVSKDPMFEEGYPYSTPKVFLNGSGEVYTNRYCSNWDDDSVIVVRDKYVVKYTRSTFIELLARNEPGEIVWMDGRNAPCSSRWNGEYLNKERLAQEYTIEEYDIETNKKRKYKVVLEEETELNIYDYASISKFVDADKLGSHFKIENNVLRMYVGNDARLIIPIGVEKLEYPAYWTKKEFDCIVIPKTLVEISKSFFTFCKTKDIIVAEDNPRFYSKDGCLIDKETQTLVWGYAAVDIPRDASIKKIGSNAFCNREDLEKITIPDNIVEIGSYAFERCKNMKCVLMSDAVRQIDNGAFRDCESLSLVNLSRSLSTINIDTFSYCSSLETIDIPDSVVTVESDAFNGCNNLKEMGVSLKSIEIIEKALNVTLVRNGDRWLIDRPVSIHKTSLAIDSTGCVF